MKYRDVVRDTMQKFEELSISSLFPNLDYSNENQDYADSLSEKKRLALEHYKAIDKADVVYLITPGGYMGTSCKIELGYAVAKNKPVYFSEPTQDLALDCYVTDFISTDTLERFSDISINYSLPTNN